MLMAAQGPGRMIWYVGPNDRQSKRIAWVRLKQLTEPYWAKAPNETERRIELMWGSTLVVNGAFKPETLRGEGLDFLVLDEYASMRAEAWFEVFLPALADRRGRALFIGTPQGRNHFYQLYEHALSDPDWEAFQFTTAQGGLVGEAELQQAARNLDEQTFRQEFEAEFATVAKNRVYLAFERALNVKAVSFDAWRPLVWSIDFNVNPMCMLLMQQMDEEVHVLEEIIIKPDAHTELACERFRARAQAHYETMAYYQRPMKVKIYGDASGNQRRTSAGAQTDWTIVKQFFERWKGTFVPQYYTANANPAVKDRVNSVNARLQNRLKEARLFIDPRCKELIRDLEEVTWAVDATGARTGELNKKDAARTHASDALGYFVSEVFSLKGKVGLRGDGGVLSF
jgi:hypothetical protein